MVKEKLKIRVLEQNSGTTLQEFDLDQVDQAYALAASLEEMGLDVHIEKPTLSDTLSHSLGLSEEEIKAYKDSLTEEIEEHDGDYGGSCVFKKES